jgi:hypothetical protein
VKYNKLSALNVAIQENILGANKTWRGFIFVPITNAFLLFLLSLILGLPLQHPAALGFLLGLMYVLFELPNSFIKRRFGIKPGEKSGLLFFIFDKTDSALGVCLFYFLSGHIDLFSACNLFLVCSLTHITISQLLVILKIKKTL